MSLVESRYAIVETLSEMDKIQTQQVLDYINSLLKSEAEDENLDAIRQQAMVEINQALRETV